MKRASGSVEDSRAAICGEVEAERVGRRG